MTKGQIGQDFSNYQPTPTAQSPLSEVSINIPNPKLYKNSWEQNKAVSIPNLFPEFQMDELWNYYYTQSDDWWNHVIHPDPYFDYPNAEPGYYHMHYLDKNDPSFDERDAYSRELNKLGKFSYQYYRTDHAHGKQHPYLNLFQHPKFISFIEYVTGFENLQAPLDATFISNYQTGHYNGPHTDGPNGRIAFVFHMSRNWRPEYGGLFMRTDWDYLTVNKSVTPKYNTLTMFDTSDGGAPHLVSEVVKGCDNKRISYTGWYK
jgi:hypothetical protein